METEHHSQSTCSKNGLSSILRGSILRVSILRVSILRSLYLGSLFLESLYTRGSALYFNLKTYSTIINEVELLPNVLCMFRL